MAMPIKISKESFPAFHRLNNKERLLDYWQKQYMKEKGIREIQPQDMAFQQMASERAGSLDRYKSLLDEYLEKNYVPKEPTPMERLEARNKFNVMRQDVETNVWNTLARMGDAYVAAIATGRVKGYQNPFWVGMAKKYTANRQAARIRNEPPIIDDGEVPYPDGVGPDYIDNVWQPAYDQFGTEKFVYGKDLNVNALKEFYRDKGLSDEEIYRRFGI